MRRTLASVAAVTVIGAAAACTPQAVGTSAGPVGHGGTMSGAASQSPTPGAADQGAASNGGTMQGMAADTASYVQAASYSFRTVDDAADPTFNQLLGINDDGVIAGYFGAGAQGHPNPGFRGGGGARGDHAGMPKRGVCLHPRGSTRRAPTGGRPQPVRGAVRGAEIGSRAG